MRYVAVTFLVIYVIVLTKASANQHAHSHGGFERLFHLIQNYYLSILPKCSYFYNYNFACDIQGFNSVCLVFCLVVTHMVV